ncbi:MAG: hypothetical protein FK734_20240 [Asgard group archaeon]|nr:hypothetical protein [Asgard group archaeon]
MIKKQRLLIIFMIFLCVITPSIASFATQINSYVIIDPPPVYPPPYFTSTPSAKTVNEGVNVRLTWTAYSFASQSSRKAYIYIDNVLVRIFSAWSNGQSLYFDFSTNTPKIYSFKCVLTDAYGSRSNTVSVTILNIPEWTVMFYLAGDNDAIVNDGAVFKDGILTDTGSDDEIQLISLLDLSSATSKYCYYGPDSQVTRIDQGELNLGAEETLEDFIDWGIANYYAKNYMVVLFDHGMGIMNYHSPYNIGGVCYDMDGTDYLTPMEIKTALSGKNIDILGMDACLMGSTEIMYTVRNEVDYYVGSEEVEPAGISSAMGITILDDDGMSSGWPYELIFPWLKAHPTSSAASLASMIVDKYEESWSRIFNVEVRFLDFETGRWVVEIWEFTFDGTMSAIDTSYMTSIATQFTSLTTSLYPYLVSNGADLYNIRTRCETFYLNHYIDLYDFLNEILAEPILSSLYTSVQTLRSTISNAVINYAYFQSGMSFSHGMSLYFPAVTGTFWSEYLNTQWNIETGWGIFLQSFFNTDVLPVISSPADFYALAGEQYSITWTGNPKETGSFTYEIYRGYVVESGSYSQSSSTITYTFTAPLIPVGHIVDYVFKCRIYNSWGYTEDTVTVHVVNLIM